MEFAKIYLPIFLVQLIITQCPTCIKSLPILLGTAPIEPHCDKVRTEPILADAIATKSSITLFRKITKIKVIRCDRCVR